MRVIEYRIIGKSREPDRCEDAIAITECYVAVIDGATDKSGRLINGKTPGKAIADLLAEFFMKEKRRLFGMELVEELNKHVRHFLGASDPAQSTEGLPSASIAVFTQGSNQLTLVGDVRCAVNGRPLTFDTPKIDQLLGEVRALYSRLLLAEGVSVEELRRDDPGREIIMPLLRKQHLLRNVAEFGDWSYGAIDGRSPPEPLVRVQSVKAEDEIVFCTDGYPEALSSLNKAEEALARRLSNDPMRLADEPGTKGFGPNAVSYDDRAYVRFVVTA